MIISGHLMHKLGFSINKNFPDWCVEFPGEWVSITNSFTMEINQLHRADLLDILFDGRNKAYGAYDLRKTYNSRLVKALAFTGSLCVLLLGGYLLAGKLSKRDSISLPQVTDVTLKEISLPENKPEPLPPKPKPLVQTQQIAMIKDVTTRIVPDAQVKPDEAPPKNDDIQNARIGLANTQGQADNGEAPTLSLGGSGTGLAEAPKKQDADDNTIFEKVEIPSTYYGGDPAWERFLRKTMRFPEAAIEKEIQGAVLVQFIVDKEGNVSNVEAISGPDELRDEAVRTIRKSGKWNPAIQNGRKVNSYKRQPIVFMFSTE
jgi:protein TonB